MLYSHRGVRHLRAAMHFRSDHVQLLYIEYTLRMMKLVVVNLDMQLQLAEEIILGFGCVQNQKPLTSQES